MNLLAIDTTVVIVASISGFFSLCGLVLVALINKKVVVIGKNVDGKMEKLLEATGAKEHAEGKAEGKKEQRKDGDETADKVVQAIKDDPDVTVIKT